MKKLPVPPLLLLVLALALIFAIIVNLFDSQLGSHLLAEMFGITLVVLVIDQLINRENRIRWKPYSSMARETVKEGVYDVFADICEITRILLTVDSSELPPNLPPDDNLALFDGLRLRELVRLAKRGKDAIANQIDKDLVNGTRHSLLEEHYRHLNDLETKYGSHLDPQELSALLDLENWIRAINTAVRERKRAIEITKSLVNPKGLDLDRIVETEQSVVYGFLVALINTLDTLANMGLLNAKISSTTI